MVKTAQIKEPEGKRHPLPDLSKLVSNGPGREDTLFAVGQLKRVDAELELAKAKRKKLRNFLKIQGHSLDSLDWNISEERRRDGTETAKWRERVRVAQFMNLPIGTQVSFIENPAAAAAPNEDAMKRAYDEGFELGIKGEFPDEQKWIPLTVEGGQHRSGWDDAQKTYRDKFEALNAAIVDNEKQDEQKRAAKVKKAAGQEADAQHEEPDEDKAQVH